MDILIVPYNFKKVKIANSELEMESSEINSSVNNSSCGKLSQRNKAKIIINSVNHESEEDDSAVVIQPKKTLGKKKTV